METDVVEELEDGEIEENDCEPVDELYTPLERPHMNTAPSIPIVTEPSDHDEQSSESSSDSDVSEHARRLAKQKKKTLNQKLRSAASQQPRKRDYSIWCADATEEILTNNLLNCNVDRSKDRSRDVESYDHSLAYAEDRGKDGGVFKSSGREEHSNKRKRHERPLATARRKYKSKHAEPQIEMTSRTILPLSKTVEDSAEELAQDMANKLLEEKESVILSVIEVLGKEKAIQLFEETVQVEHNGGLLIMNGMRRRTPGGVFFFLLKSSSDVKPEQVTDIFRDDRRKLARDIKKSKATKRREAINREDYPTLLSKAEAAIYKIKEIEASEEAEEVKNPPPSPATDGRDNSTDGEESKPVNLLHSPDLRLDGSPLHSPALGLDSSPLSGEDLKLGRSPLRGDPDDCMDI